MIQFNRPRKSYRKDDKFRQGLAHQVDAREAFARPPLAADSRRSAKGYGQDFMQTHDPIGYIPSEVGSLPNSQFSIPFIPSASGPFTQDLSQSSVFNRKNIRSMDDGLEHSQQTQRYIPGSSTFANHALGWQMGNSQNLYSSQSSIGLTLSQSDRVRMMNELNSQNGSNVMSQDSVQYPYEDYKSQDISAMMSQDFDIRSQASQSFTQF